jgi:hypothetical protein
MQLTKGHFTIQIKCDYQFGSVPFFPDCHIFSQKPFIFSVFLGEFQAFLKSQKIIFVHGCFWHMHRCRYGRVRPATHTKFWQDKRRGNVDRDKRNLKNLRKAGWKVLVVWECQIKKPEKLIGKISKFLKK